MQIVALALQEIYKERRSAKTLQSAYEAYDKVERLVDEDWLVGEEQLEAPRSPKRK